MKTVSDKSLEKPKDKIWFNNFFPKIVPIKR